MRPENDGRLLSNAGEHGNPETKYRHVARFRLVDLMKLVVASKVALAGERRCHRPRRGWCLVENLGFQTSATAMRLAAVSLALRCYVRSLVSQGV